MELAARCAPWGWGMAKGMDRASWASGTLGRSVVSLLQALPTCPEPLGGGIWEESAGSRGWPSKSPKGRDLGGHMRERRCEPHLESGGER